MRELTRRNELRDRYLDHVNSDPSLLLPQARYEVARQLPEGIEQMQVLPGLRRIRRGRRFSPASGSAAWLVTGRVVVVLIAGCPFTGAAAGAFNTFRFVTDYGMDWSLLAWLPLGVGYFLLGLLFLTQTFRCAVNATRAHSIRLPRPASGS